MNTVLKNNFDIKEVQQCLKNSLKEKFENSLSKKPFCSDNLNYGLQIRNKQIALEKKYIQPNTPFNFSWFCFDVDYPNVLETTFREKFLPAPNFIIINPENNHSHLLYGIKDRIHLSDNSSLHAIQYAHVVQYILRERLNADKGYSGLMIKNPTHSHWITKELEPTFWTLGQLSDFFILPSYIPKRESLIGLGRNCTLFELSRKYAYSRVLKDKTDYSKDYFYNCVLSYIQNENLAFPEPLTYGEYKGIAKSVSNWTWRYYGDKTTPQWQRFVKISHSSKMQSYRGSQNTSEGQSLKGKANTSENQSLKGKANTSGNQSLKGKANTSENQSLKGKANTSEIQSLKGKANTSENQSLKGKANTSENQSLKGKANTSEVQKIKAIKSAQARYKDSAEKLKPWEELNISRSWYYTQKSIGAI